jgi:hypothetical protein
MECSNQYLPECDLHTSKFGVKGGGGHTPCLWHTKWLDIFDENQLLNCDAV